jgi:hypothetical protein
MKMSTKLENVKWEVLSLIDYNNTELRAKFDEIYQQVVEANKMNVAANIPVGRIDTEELYIGDMDYAIDYSVITGTRTNEDGDEFESEKEYEQHLESRAADFIKVVKWWEFDDELFDEYEEALNALANYNDSYDEECTEADIKTVYWVQDEDDDFYGVQHDTEEEAQDAVPEHIEEWKSLQTAYEDLEVEPHEIMWNYAWRYNGYDADQELAEELGLAALEVHTGQHEEDSFVTIRGCGMDLSPKLTAYKAFTFGYIDSGDVSKLDSKTSRDYFRHVCGKKVYIQVLKKLGIWDIVKELDGLEDIEE